MDQPIDAIEVFDVPWEGDASIWLPWYLRWLWIPRRFRFRTDVSRIDADNLLVIDTVTFPNGKSNQRRMNARQVSPTEFELSADDLPQGARQHWHQDGFDFEPYRLRVDILSPIVVTLRVTDQIRFAPDRQSLLDTLEMRFLGILVGRISMRQSRLREQEAERPH